MIDMDMFDLLPPRVKRALRNTSVFAGTWAAATHTWYIWKDKGEEEALRYIAIQDQTICAEMPQWVGTGPTLDNGHCGSGPMPARHPTAWHGKK